MDTKDKMIRLMLIIIILLSAYSLWISIIANNMIVTDEFPILVTIDGQVTDMYTFSPISSVHVTALSDSLSVSDYTGINGSYRIEIPIKTDSSLATISCSKEGYVDLQNVTITKADAIYNVYWNQMIVTANFQLVPPERGTLLNNTVFFMPASVDMITTIFNKLDYSYLMWSFPQTIPNYTIYSAGMTIFGNQGNDTQIEVWGFIPDRVDVTFFNGTHIASTSYYPKLSYWTDPEIVKGKE